MQLVLSVENEWFFPMYPSQLESLEFFGELPLHVDLATKDARKANPSSFDSTQGDFNVVHVRWDRKNKHRRRAGYALLKDIDVIAVYKSSDRESCSTLGITVGQLPNQLDSISYTLISQEEFSLLASQQHINIPLADFCAEHELSTLLSHKARPLHADHVFMIAVMLPPAAHWPYNIRWVSISYGDVKIVKTFSRRSLNYVRQQLSMDCELVEPSLSDALDILQDRLNLDRGVRVFWKMMELPTGKLPVFKHLFPVQLAADALLQRKRGVKSFQTQQHLCAQAFLYDRIDDFPGILGYVEDGAQVIIDRLTAGGTLSGSRLQQMLRTEAIADEEHPVRQIIHILDMIYSRPDAYAFIIDAPRDMRRQIASDTEHFGKLRHLAFLAFFFMLCQQAKKRLKRGDSISIDLFSELACGEMEKYQQEYHFALYMLALFLGFQHLRFCQLSTSDKDDCVVFPV